MSAATCNATSSCLLERIRDKQHVTRHDRKMPRMWLDDEYSTIQARERLLVFAGHQSQQTGCWCVGSISENEWKGVGCLCAGCRQLSTYPLANKMNTHHVLHPSASSPSGRLGQDYDVGAPSLRILMGTVSVRT
jgi:hypothetical protein